jgi:hypothetical protein
MGYFGNNGRLSVYGQVQLKQQKDSVTTIGSYYRTLFEPRHKNSSDAAAFDELIKKQPVSNVSFDKTDILIVGAVKDMQFSNCYIDCYSGVVKNCSFENCIFSVRDGRSHLNIEFIDCIIVNSVCIENPESKRCFRDKVPHCSVLGAERRRRILNSFLKEKKYVI